MCYAANAALSLHEYYDRYRTGSPTNSHTPEDAELNRLIDATNASADVNAQNKAFKDLIKYENENMFTMARTISPSSSSPATRSVTSNWAPRSSASTGTSRIGTCSKPVISI
jgi:aminopeptidase N